MPRYFERGARAMRGLLLRYVCFVLPLRRAMMRYRRLAAATLLRFDHAMP